MPKQPLECIDFQGFIDSVSVDFSLNFNETLTVCLSMSLSFGVKDRQDKAVFIQGRPTAQFSPPFCHSEARSGEESFPLFGPSEGVSATEESVTANSEVLL